MTGLFIIGVALFVGAAFGILGFIGFCKAYWALQDLKDPVKQKVMTFIHRVQQKIESL